MIIARVHFRASIVALPTLLLNVSFFLSLSGPGAVTGGINEEPHTLGDREIVMG